LDLGFWLESGFMLTKIISEITDLFCNLDKFNNYLKSHTYEHIHKNQLKEKLKIPLKEKLKN
jgi:hypothetical protein